MSLCIYCGQDGADGSCVATDGSVNTFHLSCLPKAQGKFTITDAAGNVVLEGTGKLITNPPPLEHCEIIKKAITGVINAWLQTPQGKNWLEVRRGQRGDSNGETSFPA
jgi:hypothetical protein